MASPRRRFTVDSIDEGYARRDAETPFTSLSGLGRLLRSQRLHDREDQIPPKS